MSVDNGVSNPSTNRPFEDVLSASLSRRRILGGSLALAATTFFVDPGVAGASEDDDDDDREDNWSRNRNRKPLVGFTPAENIGGPNPSIAPEYQYSVLIPWGTPLFEGVPELDPTNVAANGSANQELQVGIGHDGMWFFADESHDDDRGRDDDDDDRHDGDHDDDLSNTSGVLCINHEFGSNDHVLRKSSAESLEDVRTSQAAHGMSCVEISQRDGEWSAVVPAARNRRITPNTPVVFSGPAADSPLLQTPAGNAPAGTVNNCANGYTPWGTYLTCEENFNGYFGANAEFAPTAEQARYGLTATGFGYGWHVYDERWDLTNPQYTNEENRFGWIVEVDPNDPDAPPIKRTTLGRFKHEGIATTIGRGGRVVAYMGDDERFDYIYRFVSKRNYKSMLARGQSPLDDGTLYVARFNDNNTGDWLPLTTDNPALAGWTIDQILVNTRLAADAVGATPMDRPEWTTVGTNQNVFCTLTNNSRRTVADAANPLAPNPDGHIIRWRDTRRHTGNTFSWDIFVLAKDTHIANGGDASYEFGSPDGLWADPDKRLFIETDGGQPNGRNNQLVVADIQKKEFRRLLAGVAGDEITGLTVTPDRRTMFCNTQHPGDGDPAASNFPVPGAGGPEVPRDATFVITRRDGGIIGS